MSLATTGIGTTADLRPAQKGWPDLSSRAMLILACLGTSHLVVDATCGYLAARVAGMTNAGQSLGWLLIVVYNVVAFGGQPFFGLMVDCWKANRPAGAAGCLIVACSVPGFAFSPPLGMVLAGIGNALFHVAAGGVSLRLTPGQAAAPGLFVAPGAIGLALGMLAGRAGTLPAWMFVLISVAAAAGCYLAVPPTLTIPGAKRDLPAQAGRMELVLALLCFAIAVRSLSGLAMTSLWRSAPPVMIVLALAAVAGKAVAGILADRFGWLQVTIPAMLVAVPLASFGQRIACLVVPGMLLVQVAMPVTLAAIGRLFPSQPSFAFGLASLALVIGAMPIFFGAGPVASDPRLSCILQLASASALLLGLAIMRQTRISVSIRG